MATLKKGKIILEPNEASKLLALIHLTRAKRSFDIDPLRGLEDFEKKTFVDISAPKKDILTPEDETVLKAYGWLDIDLAHDFYEVDYLPENDRVRYTISPEARKELLKRLLKLNHEIHEQEIRAGLHEKGKIKKNSGANQMTLFE